MSPDDRATVTSTGQKAVPVAAVEPELTRLWQEHTADGLMSRACMSNLVIFCASHQEAERLPAEIGEVVSRHPSRVLLVINDGNDSEVEAWISALCHLSGGRQRICSEHVTLSASGAASRHLVPAVRSLLIGDLPTALWWTSRQPPLSSASLFSDLASMVDQVIYDSSDWANSVSGVIETADWVRGGKEKRFVFDLAWRRLTPIRRLISQTLDPTASPNALETISQVYIEHTPHALPQSWLLIGWLSHLLGWQPTDGHVEPGRELTWGFVSDGGPVQATIRRLSEGEPDIRRVRIRWGSNDAPHTVELERTDDGRLAFTLGHRPGPSRSLTLPPMPRSQLVVEQLRKLFHDDLFERTLEVSRTMAKALGH